MFPNMFVTLGEYGDLTHLGSGKSLFYIIKQIGSSLDFIIHFLDVNYHTKGR